MALFLVMLGYITYFQVKKSQEVIRSPYNARQNSNEKQITRGKILDKNGNVLAKTDTASDGTQTRDYPYGNVFAHVVGYSAQGKSGIESLENTELMNSDENFLIKLKNQLQDKKNVGNTVITTLDADLQQAAYQALGDNRGAVVVMDPKTGKILAMVSKPDFDPNTVVADWDTLSSSGDSVLLNRATQGQYAPGSTFKVVTTLEYMRENPDYASYSYNCRGSIERDGIRIHCYNGHVHGQVDLQDSLAYSCNASFSNIGLSLDPSKFKNTAEDVLFDSKLPSDLPYSKSSFTLDSSAGNGTKMMTAMGQGETQVTPYKELMTADEAGQLKVYMKSVVDYGTASVLSGQSYTAAGKTGTAEYSSDKEKDHSWFIGMSNVEDPELVVSIIIESSDGNAKAVNVAKEIFDSYYNQ